MNIFETSISQKLIHASWDKIDSFMKQHLLQSQI